MMSHEFDVEKLKKKPQNQQDATQQKLLHWVETEVKKRLQQSLHNRVYIVLDKDTLFWLGWLAKQLIRENKTELMVVLFWLLISEMEELIPVLSR